MDACGTNLLRFSPGRTLAAGDSNGDGFDDFAVSGLGSARSDVNFWIFLGEP